MAILTKEEVAQKLAQLKQYSRDFDVYEARWKASYGKKDAYEAMMEAERNYVSLSDRLWSQGIAVFWNREKRQYIAICRNFVLDIK